VVSVALLILCCSTACQPTIDLSGIYIPFDYPWSGPPRIDIETSFPSPLFSGMYTNRVVVEYVEIPIYGIINDQDEAKFYPFNEDPPISGLCVCKGFDDGGSIFVGSGEIADDGISDRLACTTYLGEPFQPPLEVFRIDW
jgi:hypothetical protein